MAKILITGASSGIGATYADRLSAAGHDLILVARDRAKLEALAEKLGARDGTRIEILPADLAVPADLRDVERRLLNDGIDTLINNAGVSVGGAFESADPDRLEHLIDLNITAVTRLAAAAAAAFTARGHGTIVNIGSVTALLPERFEPTYLASKAYVLAFSQALAAQLADKGVRVQAVLPRRHPHRDLGQERRRCRQPAGRHGDGRRGHGRRGARRARAGRDGDHPGAARRRRLAGLRDRPAEPRP